MTGIPSVQTRPLASLFPRNLVGSKSPDVRNQQAAMTRALDDIDRLREPRLRASVLASLRGIEDTWRVREATTPAPQDGEQTRQIRADYLHLYDQSRRLHSHATQLAEIFAGRGAGPHRLHGGRTVIFGQDQLGLTQVTIRKPTGESQTVSYHPDNPERTTVSTREADGRESVVERDGHRVSRSEGSRVQRYTLGPNGLPQLETDGSVVQVRPDGSAVKIK
jgi:hypothetical protein